MSWLLLMSGKGNPMVALFAAQLTPPNYDGGLMIDCTLPSAERSICDASVRFFLVSQSDIRAEVGRQAPGG